MIIVLTLICIIAGAALGYVNQTTAPAIAQIEQEQLTDGLRKVLGAQDLTVEETQEQPDGTIVYHTTAGTAVRASDPKGFGGELSVLVGLSESGTILGYEVMKSQETPGLGAKATEWFQKGNRGDIIGKQAGALSVTKDGGEVDAITASTITSRAFLRCINKAYAALGTQEQSDAQSGASKQQHN